MKKNKKRAIKSFSDQEILRVKLLKVKGGSHTENVTILQEAVDVFGSPL